MLHTTTRSNWTPPTPHPHQGGGVVERFEQCGTVFLTAGREGRASPSALLLCYKFLWPLYTSKTFAQIPKCKSCPTLRPCPFSGWWRQVEVGGNLRIWSLIDFCWVHVQNRIQSKTPFPIMINGYQNRKGYVITTISQHCTKEISLL